MERNARIRLQIMLIAVIGGLAFLSYLLVNVVLAAVNADRLDRLQHHHYPIIEEIRLLQQDLNSMREGFATAVGLEDPVLLDDTRQVVQHARERLVRLQTRDPDLADEVEGISAAFEAYVQPALLLTEALVTDPRQLPGYKDAMEASLRDYQLLSDWIGGLHAARQAAYRNLLRETNLAVNRANLWGAVLGALVIAVLGVLAWAISARVLREVNRSDRLKDAFLSAISHELRTPMNGIIGALSLLRATTLDREQVSWLDVANRSASSMMSSIDDLLQFSELMAGQEALHVGEFRLRGGLTRLLAALRPEFEDKNLALEFYGGVVLDRVLVSHEGKILYVIRHLLSNALKFSDRGPVCLSIGQANQSAAVGEGSIRVLVQDAGPGIPEPLLAELGRPFRQLDGSFSRRHGGMGIGLATCHAITRLLNGSLTLRNRESGGLEVEFIVPVKFGDTAPESGPDSTTLTGGSYRRSGLVLVAEDNLVNLMVLKGYLKHLGCNVVSARNGYQALDLMQSKLVDLVLMDCQMPLMDGLEATRQIRKLPEPLRDTPIVALTANATDTDRRNCLDCGMNGFLKKPVSLEELRAVLGHYLVTVQV